MSSMLLVTDLGVQQGISLICYRSWYVLYQFQPNLKSQTRAFSNRNVYKAEYKVSHWSE